MNGGGEHRKRVVWGKLYPPICQSKWGGAPEKSGVGVTTPPLSLTICQSSRKKKIQKLIKRWKCKMQIEVKKGYVYEQFAWFGVE